jgi:hypothetical protein
MGTIRHVSLSRSHFLCLTEKRISSGRANARPAFRHSLNKVSLMPKADLKISRLGIFVHQPWGGRHNSISPAPEQSNKEHHKDARAHMCGAAQTREIGCFSQPVGLKSLCVAALRIVSPRKVVVRDPCITCAYQNVPSGCSRRLYLKR